MAHPQSYFGPYVSQNDLNKAVAAAILEQTAPTSAEVAHSIAAAGLLSESSDNADVTAALDALGTKINEVITALQAAGIFD